MPPNNEEDMYKLICKDRFTRIDEKLDEISSCIKNNNGLIVRVTENATSIRRITCWGKWGLGVFTSVLVFVIISLIKLLW